MVLWSGECCIGWYSDMLGFWRRQAGVLTADHIVFFFHFSVGPVDGRDCTACSMEKSKLTFLALSGSSHSNEKE